MFSNKVDDWRFVSRFRFGIVDLQSLFSIFLLVFFITSCGSDEATRVAEGVVIPTATFLPTPTLAAGAPTNPPPSPTSEVVEDTVALDVDETDTSTELSAGVSTTESTPLPTLTPLPSPTPTLPPTATPHPDELVDLGKADLANGNFASAAAQFETGLLVANLEPDERQEALYLIGVAYLQDDRFTAALNSFNQLLAETAGDAPSATYFHMGQALTATGDYRGALGAYQQYLDKNPDMVAYVGPIMAELYFISDERENGVAMMETAVTGPSHRLTEFGTRQQLVQLYTADGRFVDVLAQYDAMLTLARTEQTRGQLTYQAGLLERQLGDEIAAIARFQTGIANYPGAYESYLGLVELVGAEVPVDEFQRGLVNYNANSYEPCIAAFDRYFAAAETINNDAFLYQAYCFEGLGNVESALTLLDASPDTAKALFEKAEMLERWQFFADALEAYQTYVNLYPRGANVAEAAWKTAVLTEQLGDVATAIVLYQEVAAQYPAYEDAAQGLFYAGWLANGIGNVETPALSGVEVAVSAWQTAANNYPNHEFGAASMIWLLRLLPDLPADFELVVESDAVTETLTIDDLQTSLIDAAEGNIGTDFYSLRVKGIVAEQNPFASERLFAVPTEVDEAALQAEAESWLATQLNLESDEPISELSPKLAEDMRLIVGEALWQIGLFESAKRELEALRVDMSDDALASYQLAVYFRDLGLYRSSILAANSVLRVTGNTVFEAPKFISQLSYPVYYTDLVLPLAEQYDYDPRLQFALLRQESLFESFARSGAAAQGLSQVIPDTGIYIAQQLNWPNFNNEDLYKPYVGLNFGAFYLAQQLDSFGGDVHAALSAYNAGPGNAARWHNMAGDDLDLYVRTVDFWETREYVKRIFAGYEIYSFLYSSD